MTRCFDKAIFGARFAGLLLATSGLVSAAALAQTTPAGSVPDASATAKPAPAATSDNGQIGEIIVTAQRREEALSKVPIAVTAITPAQLQTSGVSSTIDLPRVTPGLAVGSSTQANAYFTPVLRGVGALTSAVGNDNSVALYVDGIYQSDKTASNIDLAAISQIDVLKGPQGTLFGRNATGGAINVTTRGPTSKSELEAEASYGNLNKWTGRLFAGQPLTDNLGISIAYLHRDGGDYEENINPLYAGKFGGTRVNAVQGKIVWHPGNFEAIASVIYYDRQFTDLNPLSPVPGTNPIGVQAGGTAGFARYTYTGTPNFGTVSYFQPSLKLRYSAPGFDIVSISGYVHANTSQGLDYDGTSANLFYFYNTVKVRDISQELQALTTGGGPLQVTGGLYYFRGHPETPELDLVQNVAPGPGNTTNFAGAATAPGGSITNVDEGGIVHAKAVYAQATYAITHNTKFTAGLRYSDEDRTYDYSVSGIGGPGSGLPPVLTPLYSVSQPKVTYKKLTWRFALDHQFTDSILGYVSYNRGFKSGVYNFSDYTPPCAPGAAASTCPPPAVKPEVLDAFEAGVKSKLFDRRVEINAAAFYYDYRNLQVSRITATATASQQLQNAGSEHIYGVDGNIIWRVTPDITFRANGSYLHARFGSYQNAGGFLIDANGVPYAASIDASGTKGLAAPTLSFDVGGDYTIHTGESKFVFTGDYYHTSSFKTVVGEGNFVHAYGRLNAALTWYAPGEKYYVRGFGQNLTNVEQIGTGTSPFRLAKAEIEPRTYGVAVGFKF